MTNAQVKNIALRKCKDELEEVGVEFKDDLNFDFIINTNKRRYGYCKYDKIENKITIAISKWLFKRVNNTNHTVLDTIMHEMIHASGIWNHGNQFKKIARLVNQKYGYNVQTSSDGKLDDDSYKYILKCKECGSKVRRHKKSKVIKRYKDYVCKCGGKFERIK